MRNRAMNVQNFLAGTLTHPAIDCILFQGPTWLRKPLCLLQNLLGYIYVCILILLAL